MALLTTAALIAFAISRPSPQTIRQVEVQFETNSSILTKVGFTKVTLTQGADSFSRITPESGYSRHPILVEAGVPVTIRLEGTAAADGRGNAGITIGQQFEHVFENTGSGQDRTHLLHTHQPFADWLAIDASVPVTCPHNDRWFLHPRTSTASYSFQAHVAFLSCEQAIDGYEAYAGVAFPRDGYALGIVVRSEEVDLGPEGMLLQVDARDYGFPAMPFADGVIVTDGNGTGGFTLQPIAWEDEKAVYELRGDLGRGSNLVLLYEPPVGQTQGATASSHAVASVPQLPQPDTTVPSTSPGDCNPPAPTPPPGFTCTPNTGFHDADCPPPTVIFDQEVHRTRKIFQACGSGGQSRSREFTDEFNGSLEGEFKLNGIPFKVSGGFSHKITETAGFQFSDGANGCGECHAIFRHYVVRTIGEVKEVELFGGWFGPCVDCQAWATCQEYSGSSGTKCSRTCE